MDITLFHYPFSPYAEKVRCMFGYCGIKWNSFEVDPYPPRPTLYALSGGYGRIPAAQIGADIFCDSQIIVEEIVAASGDSSLDIYKGDEQAKQLVKRAQGDIFFGVVASGSPLKILTRMILGFGPKRTYRFIKDRTSMASNSSLKLQDRKTSQNQLDDFLDDLEGQLNQAFLGGNKPTAVDFCVYHPLWMLRTGIDPRPPKNHPKVLGWMDRMASYSHAAHRELTEDDVFQNAKSNQPRALPESIEGESIGKQVAVGPADYRLETVEGELVAETDRRWIVKRCSSELGDLHVHFPKDGYQLSS